MGMVIPSALNVLRLKHGSFCSLGRLGHEFGWKYQDIVAALEAKRKVKDAFYKGKLEVAKARKACMTRRWLRPSRPSRPSSSPTATSDPVAEIVLLGSIKLKNNPSCFSLLLALLPDLNLSEK